MTMNILEKKAGIRALWQLCFHDDERFVDLLFDHLYRDENALCFEEHGVLTTALQMLPYRLTYGSSVLGVSYISGAATRPEYRNRGLMSRLLKQSFEVMRSRGIPLSVLIPAEPWLYGYYATKGYAPVFFRRECDFTAVHRFEGAGYRRVNLSHDELYRFFDAQMRRRSCCLLHEPDDFEVICGDNRLDGGEVVALANEVGELSALAFVVPHDDRTVVKELLAVSDEAHDAALHEAMRLFPGVPLTVMAPPESEEGSLQRVGMMRIVDVPAMLSAVAQNHPGLQVVVRVTDPLLPGNDGAYRLGDGECRCVETDSCDLDVDVAELALVIFGDSHQASLIDFPSMRPYMSLMLD
ncbi:MAG TPA: GNAT family N-acetyltransferase [Candidatus Barnesiella merdipullorum]|nr:GNAT family N-acetyltransferase [Candidatus Barnesiella merdipullorum]